jgi:ankyrin repeat protein
MEDVMSARLSDNSFAPRPGFTELMLAAAQADGAAIRRELSAGAKVNAQDASGFSALMCAARTGDAAAVGILLQAAADANLGSNLGQTALMAASSAAVVSEPVLRLLIAAGADVNARDRKGVSALMMAVTQAEPAVISRMLTAGARMDLAGAAGRTALDRVTTALWSIDTESASLAELDVRNKSERQAGLAIRRRRLERVHDLLNQVIR